MKKNNKKNKKKVVLDKYVQDIYPPYNLYVMINHTSEDITKRFVWDDGVELDPVDPDEYQGVTWGLVYNKDDKDKKLSVLVCLNCDKFDDEIDAINTIAHEAFHAVFRITKHCNIDLCECTNEPFAFLQGWATKCIWKTYKKYKK